MIKKHVTVAMAGELKLELEIAQYGKCLHFILRPYGEEANFSNTRHCSKQEEAVSVLLDRGFSNAEEIVAEAIEQIIAKMIA